MNIDELYTARKEYTADQWMDLLLRSVGMEPANLKHRTKWHLIARMIPFVENNYNVCELGPRGTGKSHVYKECSPNSLLVSGGQTTVANLFYNMSTRQIGLVGMWDVVAFDEVAGIRFKDKDGIQIMKDYMASGSFSRGRDSIEGKASMVFVGNIDHSVEMLVKTSHLLAPFPEEMVDCAHFDRFNAYIPGWEIPKMRPELFTDRFGLITDYLAEYMREMRKTTFADAIDKFFKLGNNLNQRDVIGVRRTTSGLLKLLFPDGRFIKEDVRTCLTYAFEVRRRIKEQLKKIGGMEFFDVNFSYIDNQTLEEFFVNVPEQGGSNLIPKGIPKPGVVHFAGYGATGKIGAYRIESQMTAGNGKHSTSGLGSDSVAKEPVRVGFEYFKGNLNRISATTKFSDHEYHLPAQIDHLIVYTYGFIVVESKSIRGEVNINEYGEWSRSYKGQWSGMPSPIKQAELQIILLKQYLCANTEKVISKFLGIQQGLGARCYDVFSAISSDAIIDRSKAPKDLAAKLVKSEFISDALDKKMNFKKFYNLVGKIYDTRPSFSHDEMRHICRFLLADPLPPSTVVEPPLSAVASCAVASSSPVEVTPAIQENHYARYRPVSKVNATATKDYSKYMPPAKAASLAMQCKHCGTCCGLAPQSGRYGYYIQCGSCGGNTPLKRACPACNSSQTKVSKAKLTYRLQCTGCGASFVYA